MRKLPAPIPLAPSVDVLSDARHTFSLADRGGLLICYDPVAAAGALFYIALGRWCIFCPLSRHEFVRLLRDELGFSAIDSEIPAGWLAGTGAERLQ